MLIGYARVSTVDQNLALQRDALTEAGCAKIFTEQMSGAVTDRPALHDALEFARSGDTLIVWKLDRLARSMKQLIETIENLRLRGIGFRSLTEALDTTTAQGRLVFHMFGALAEFERSLIRERTQAGLAAARRVGRTGGRPPKLTDDDIEAAKAMLANPDIGVTQIAHRLGVSPATLYRYIPAARTANMPEALSPYAGVHHNTLRRRRIKPRPSKAEVNSVSDAGSGTLVVVIGVMVPAKFPPLSNVSAVINQSSSWGRAPDSGSMPSTSNSFVPPPVKSSTRACREHRIKNKRGAVPQIYVIWVRVADVWQLHASKIRISRPGLVDISRGNFWIEIIGYAWCYCQV